MNGVLATLVLCAAAAAGDPPAAARNPLAGDLPFFEDLEAARAEARWWGKPLLVFYSLPGDGISLRVADSAFRDEAVIARAASFVPVLVDAERNEPFGLEYGVKTVPTILLLDPKGKEAGRSSSAAGPPEVLEALDLALRKMGSLPLTKAGRALAKAAGDLSKAREAGDWKGVLSAVAAVEKIDHPGPELDAARAARRDADAEAANRLAAAKKLVKDGKRDEARAAFRGIVRTFAGLDAAVEAKNLLLEMDGPDKGDDDGGSGGGGTKGKKFKGGRSHGAPGQRDD